jgi:hypothetical protein
MRPVDMHRVVASMESVKATVAGIGTLATQLKREQVWEWHVWHPGNPFIHESRRMLPCLIFLPRL